MSDNHHHVKVEVSEDRHTITFRCNLPMNLRVSSPIDILQILLVRAAEADWRWANGPFRSTYQQQLTALEESGVSHDDDEMSEAA